MDIKILVPSRADAGNLLPTVAPLPFDSCTIAFLQQLSSHILKSSRARAFPELIALGYWLRNSNVHALKKAFEESTPADTVRSGRGLAFHIAPSNVDTIFVYSLVISLLAGNGNIVRLSSTDSEQIIILIDLINEVLQDVALQPIADALRIVKYEHNQAINDFFSIACDLRIIWGGDNTVDAVRKSPLCPHATDIAFANKYSLSIIDADGWLKLSESDRDRQALLFFKDASTFNQQACSSPRMIAWVCAAQDIHATAKQDFWSRVSQVWGATEDMQAVDYSNRILYVQSHMIEHESTLENPVADKLFRLSYEGATRIEQIDFCGSGIFSELHIKSIEELGSLISRKIQTVSVAGFDKTTIQTAMLPVLARGVDRVVPFGRALDFHPVWDGYNLWEAFTRLTSFAQFD